ncbi:hypothetical protein [uncultured Acetatifactor sp.]|uniref:defense against restriction DarA-related protein n=1 Tax=uncultured Acetatifactor sp. TaxID=1671927 RepID=UPI0026165C9B|nr:hypothetical protein [uncultured Acetatifactor sp.]
MATVQGYEILKSIVFGSRHGFALGHNLAAPDAYVTWQFTEQKDGTRDYYWGEYHNDAKAAERSFKRRAAAYRDFYRIEEKSKGSGAYYRYYSTQRPVDIGTFPKPPGNPPQIVVNYGDDRRRPVADGALLAWGELLYRHPLTAEQMEAYELKPDPDNPAT